MKNALSNYGNFITWDFHPAGFWGKYGYLPHVGFVAGVPGHAYSSEWSSPSELAWYKEEVSIEGEAFSLWISDKVYDVWMADEANPTFKTIVYN